MKLLIFIMFIAAYGSSCSSTLNTPPDPLTLAQEVTKEDDWQILALQNQSANIPAPKDSELVAEAIDAETIKRFSHLQNWSGHFLLGNSKVQLILNGVPMSATESPWQPFLAAAYVRDVEGKAWRIENWYGAFDVREALKSNAPLQMIGIDGEVSEQSARVFLYFSPQDNLQQKSRIALTLQKNTPVAEMIFEDFASGKEARQGEWGLRIRSDRMQFETISDAQLNRNGIARGLIQTGTSANIGILAITPLAAQKRPHEVMLTTLKREKARQPGLLLLFGKEAVRLSANYLQVLEHCLSMLINKQDFNSVWPICTTQPPATGVLRLITSMEEVPMDKIPRQFQLRDERSRTIAMLTLPPGSAIDWELPLTGKTYTLWEDGEPTWVQKASWEPKAQQLAQLHVASRPAGHLKIAVEPEQPLLMSVKMTSRRGLLDMSGFSDQPQFAAPTAIFFTPQTSQLKLPVRSYELALFHPQLGLWCRCTVTLSKDTPTAVDCQPSSPRQSMANFMTYDMSPIAPERSSAWTRYSSAPFLWTQSPYNEQLIQTNADDAGLRLSFAPATPELRASWQAFQKKHASASMATLAQFAKEHGKDGMLILSCPDAPIAPEDYLRVAHFYDADGIEIMGCHAPSFQENALHALDEWMSRSNKPRRILAASLTTQPLTTYFQALVGIPKSDAATTPPASEAGADILTKLMNQDYGVGQGALVSLVRDDSVDTWTRKNRDIKINLRVEYQPDVKPTRLVVIGDGEVIAEEKWTNQTSDTLVKLPLQVRLRQEKKWLRIELRGQVAPRPEDETEQILATSPYIMLSP